MNLTARLRQQAAPIWEREFAHPFVQEMGSGTLDPERFKVWMRQDYLFLAGYARVLALAAARADDLDTMGRFADLLQSTLRTEMDLHRRYAQRFDIGAGDLASAVPAPTTRAYVDFLLRVAQDGPLAAIVAALLPCAWGYAEIAGRLAASRGGRRDSRYEEWIRTYTAPEFIEYATWLQQLLDDRAAGLPAAEHDRLEEIFLTSSRYEYRFWEMAYHGETWPV